jgi:hypothetical protein
VLLYDLFSFVTSGSRGWAKYYSEGGPLFIRAGNLDRDSIDLDLTTVQKVNPPEGKVGQNQFYELQRGMTKAGIGLDDIRSVWVPFPPFDEQKDQL